MSNYEGTSKVFITTNGKHKKAKKMFETVNGAWKLVYKDALSVKYHSTFNPGFDASDWLGNTGLCSSGIAHIGDYAIMSNESDIGSMAINSNLVGISGIGNMSSSVFGGADLISYGITMQKQSSDYAYNSTLVKTSISIPSSQRLSGQTYQSTCDGNYAVSVCGFSGSGGNAGTSSLAISNELITSIFNAGFKAHNLFTSKVGDYMIFLHGYQYNWEKIMFINNNLVSTTVNNITPPPGKIYTGVLTSYTNNYALFTYPDKEEGISPLAISADCVQQIINDPYEVYRQKGVRVFSHKGLSVWGGGQLDGSTFLNTIKHCDDSLIYTSTTQLNEPLYGVEGSSFNFRSPHVGNYILFIDMFNQTGSASRKPYRTNITACEIS